LSEASNPRIIETDRGRRLIEIGILKKGNLGRLLILDTYNPETIICQKTLNTI